MRATFNLLLRRRILLRICLAILALLSIWLLLQSNKPISSNDQNPLMMGRSSDYAMTDFTLTSYDEKGQVSRLLSGKYLAHYEDNQSIEVTQPISHFINNNENQWVILADKGTSYDNRDDIDLVGDVIVTRQGDNAVELRTETLQINSVTALAHSDDPVLISSGNNTTNGIGLDADLNTGEMQLHQTVRGHYETID